MNYEFRKSGFALSDRQVFEILYHLEEQRYFYAVAPASGSLVLFIKIYSSSRRDPGGDVDLEFGCPNQRQRFAQLRRKLVRQMLFGSGKIELVNQEKSAAAASFYCYIQRQVRTRIYALGAIPYAIFRAPLPGRFWSLA
jgi:hypothetical protein